MNELEKIKFLDEIGRELQSKMTFADIDNYFQGHGGPTQENYPQNSKRAYVKDMLAKVDERILFTIAGELGLIDAPRKALLNKSNFWP